MILLNSLLQYSCIIIKTRYTLNKSHWQVKGKLMKITPLYSFNALADWWAELWSHPYPKAITPLDILKSAKESGAGVIVVLKSCQGDTHQGQILDLNARTFTLFHSGTDGGILWCFELSDIACCGLVVDLPEAFQVSSSQSLLHPVNHIPDDDEGFSMTP